MKNKIDKIIRDAWEGHEIPFRDSYWNEMEKVLEEDRRRRRPVLWFFLGGMIALLAIVWAGYGILENGKTGNLDAGTIATVDKTEMPPDQSTNRNLTSKNDLKAPHSSSSQRDNIDPGEKIKSGNTVVPEGNHPGGNETKALEPGPVKRALRPELNANEKTKEKQRDSRILNPGPDNHMTEGISSLPDLEPRVFNELKIRPAIVSAFEFNDRSAIELLVPDVSLSALQAPIEIQPLELASYNASDLAIGAGYAIWPGSHVLHGPAILAEYSRNLEGIWSISAGMQVSQLGGKYTPLQGTSESAYSFGLGSKRQLVELRSMYLVAAPVSISRRLGGFKASAGLGPLFLAGIRGDRILETSHVDYKQGEFTEFNTREASMEAIWFEKSAFREWNAVGTVALEWLALPSASINLQIKYALHPLERPSEDGHSFIGENRRTSLMLTAKYYLR